MRWRIVVLLTLFAASARAETFSVGRATQPVSEAGVWTVGLSSGSSTVGVTSAGELKVLNSAIPSLQGLSFVYVSSDVMVVGGALTLTGLASQVDLQATGNDCTFNISGGNSINVSKNYSEVYRIDFTKSNLTVNLTAKSGSATCKARISGAN